MSEQPEALEVATITITRTIEPQGDNGTGDFVTVRTTAGLSIVEALGMLQFAGNQLLKRHNGGCGCGGA